MHMSLCPCVRTGMCYSSPLGKEPGQVEKLLVHTTTSRTHRVSTLKEWRGLEPGELSLSLFPPTLQMGSQGPKDMDHHKVTQQVWGQRWGWRSSQTIGIKPVCHLPYHTPPGISSPWSTLRGRGTVPEGGPRPKTQSKQGGAQETCSRRAMEHLWDEADFLAHLPSHSEGTA